ncbi:glutamine synthetase family protein [Acidipropionibacterium timonense]|uniref:glutamine synthetase family protein n=1 Tax=Acidipropionibacterium timonense TaxID=2161818 RepID=UPI00103108FA|nr:glutamine synthetase family protein [Acidipropionibacterium timonense]
MTDALMASPLVRDIGKSPDEFTRSDIVEWMADHEVRLVDLRYVAGDGRLKTLSFAPADRRHLERILTMGERVDGSSLFGFVSATSSDVYVVPRLSTAFLDPFATEPTLDLLCAFHDADGNLLESAPTTVLGRADALLRERTGAHLEALGELEYYVATPDDGQYPAVDQRGYHESEPFAKGAQIRREALSLIARIGGHVKYGHAEVGSYQVDGTVWSQHEIEYLPVPVAEAADQIVLGKWILRRVAQRHGALVTFAPKLLVGQAGSGMHVHSRLVRDGVNLLVADNGLSDDTRRLIAGYLAAAPALTAFGNTVPTSYLRLVPHQEAPTSICWGKRNRSALVRVPLGWDGVDDSMMHVDNPAEPVVVDDPAAGGTDPQTVELRSGDGSAHPHLLLAAMTMAALDGLTRPDALDLAEKLHVVGDASARTDLAQLPGSCVESARALREGRATFEEGGVFPPGLIDAQAAALEAFADEGLAARLDADPTALTEVVTRFLHCG